MRIGRNGADPAGDAGTRLIAADRLEGTPVLAADGARIGVICGLMIDRVSGRVAYAILSLGGVGDLSPSRIPLPWSSLRFDAARGVHVLAVNPLLLRTAPRSHDDAGPDWTDPAWTRRIDRHYAATNGHSPPPPHGL